MAAIMVVIEQLIEEEAQATPSSPLGLTPWKHWGLEEMMNMRILCQLRMGRSASSLAHLRRRI